MNIVETAYCDECDGYFDAEVYLDYGQSQYVELNCPECGEEITVWVNVDNYAAEQYADVMLSGGF